MVYLYECTQRPPVPGAVPREGLLDVYEIDGFGKYGLVAYDRQLPIKERDAYELRSLDNSDYLTIICRLLSQEDIALQLAEECSELAAICDKAVRTAEGNNPGRMSNVELSLSIMTELADVLNCIEAYRVGLPEDNAVNLTKIAKRREWAKRVLDAKKEKQ